MRGLLRAAVALFLIAAFARAEQAGHVVFVDSPDAAYFRHGGKEADAEPMTAVTLATATAVLLGVAPPVAVTVAASAALDALLAPSAPLRRPAAVLVLLLETTSSPEAAGGLLAVGVPHATSRTLVSPGAVDAALAALVMTTAPGTAVDLSCAAQSCGSECVAAAQRVVTVAAGADAAHLPAALTTELACLMHGVAAAAAVSPSAPPRLWTATLRGLGGGSQAADRAVTAVLASAVAAFQRAHRGSAVTAVVALPLGGGLGGGAGLRAAVARRGLLTTTTGEAYDDDDVAASDAFAKFSLAVVSGLVLLLLVAAVIYSFCYMEQVEDSLLYPRDRMTKLE